MRDLFRVKIFLLLFGFTALYGAVNIKKIDVKKEVKSKLSVGKKRRVIDKIMARVNGKNILLSDLKEPRIDKDGAFYTLKEAIDNELLFQRSAKRKLLPTALDIEKHIVSWKEAHHLTNITEEEFEERLKEDGLTGKRYRTQFGKILAVRSLRQLEVSERIVITTREVEESYKIKPICADEKYMLKTRIIPFDKAANEEAAVKNEDVNWIDIDWINKGDLSDQMKFISSMTEGDISNPVKVAEGYQMVKLEKKEKSRLKTLEESWVEIERNIQIDKMEKFESEYLVELKEKATIVYL